jgi:hypothetical protein
VLTCVSAASSIDGLTTIFAGAFWPVITMGATLEAAKLVAAAWLAENWHSAPSLLRLILVAMIGVLMSLNAVGAFGFLTRAHLEHMAAVDLALADRTADTEARLAIQGQTVADLDRRIAQIDAAVEESTRQGRPVSAMTIADQKRRDRADTVAARQREARTLTACLAQPRAAKFCWFAAVCMHQYCEQRRWLCPATATRWSSNDLNFVL